MRRNAYSWEKCNDWPRTVMTGGFLLVAFAPDGATGEDDETIEKQDTKSLPPFSLIRDFGKQNTLGNVSKISVSLTSCVLLTDRIEIHQLEPLV